MKAHLWVCFLFVALFIVDTAKLSLAHIESDSMPDSVAEMEYRILLEFKPNDVQAINKLGMVLYRQNKLADATSQFSKALEIDPENFNALDALGLVKARQKDFDAAIKLHRAAIALKQNDALVYYHLGKALEMKGLWSEARQAYQTALENCKIGQPPETGTEKTRQTAEMIKSAIANIQSKL